MGVKLKDISLAKPISFDDLRDKVLAVDAFNMLYQFLTTIRQPDGSLLVNAQGQVTSHLNGLFYRTTKLMEMGAKLVFVFDGKPPVLKFGEITRRAEKKQEARSLHEDAVQRGDIDAMKKYAGRTVTLSQEMIAESKELLEVLGVPFIQAPSEGEAQAAYLTKKGDAFAVVSQDFDSLMFGSVRLVRNLSIEGRRKRAGKLQYDFVLPEIIILEDVLRELGMGQDQLIVMGMLVGTDYNPGGIPGIGPKNALKWVKNEKDFDILFEKVKWKEHFEVGWREVFETFKEIPVTSDYELRWRTPDVGKLRELLVEKHSFSAERVDQKLQRFVKEYQSKEQKGLGQWCG